MAEKEGESPFPDLGSTWRPSLCALFHLPPQRPLSLVPLLGPSPPTSEASSTRLTINQIFCGAVPSPASLPGHMTFLAPCLSFPSFPSDFSANLGPGLDLGPRQAD